MNVDIISEQLAMSHYFWVWCLYVR